jgi:putative ABC transport system substrate-binding protein
MRRRDFITLLGGAAAAWPIAARAQQPKTAAIGYLSARSRQTEMPVLVAYHAGLREAGYVEGENVAFDYRFADGRYDELPAMAADLVRRKVDVIAVLGSTFAVLSAKQATQAIPVVFQQGADPIAAGLVTSLRRPGGNVTGAASLMADLAPKLLELLHEMVPTAATIGVLHNPNNPVTQLAPSFLPDLQVAAGTLGVELRLLQASTERDFDAAFRHLAELRAGGF